MTTRRKKTYENEDLGIKSIKKTLRIFIKSKLRLGNNTPFSTVLRLSTLANEKTLYKAILVLYNKDAEEKNEVITNTRRTRNSQARQRQRLAKKADDINKRFYQSNIVVIIKPDLSKLRKALMLNIGNDIVVEYRTTRYDGTPVNMNISYTVPRNFSSWWKGITQNDWMYDSENSYFQHYEQRGKLFIYKQNININSSKIKQYFRDGITHCMFQPIRLWAEDKVSEVVNTRAGERYKAILNKIKKYEIKYDKGVPEDAIGEICNSLQIDIKIDLPFGLNKFIDAKSEKKQLKQFEFLNTRLNHIDHNELVKTNDKEEVSRDELNEIKKELDNNNEFYTYKKDLKGISSIESLTKSYKLCNDYGRVVNEFEKTTGLKYCKLDDIDDRVLSDFIQEGMNYNSTVDFQDIKEFYTEEEDEEERELEDGEEYYTGEEVEIPVNLIIDASRVNHMDMTKAYANSKSCNFYEGYLGKITDLRQTDKIEGVGMYKITDLNFEKCDKKFIRYNDTLKIYIDNNVYCSPELKLLTSLNVEYKIVSGCWGVKPIDFDFNEEMMTKKDEGTPYYSKWAGANDSHRLEKNIWMKGNADYFKVIKDNCEEGTVKLYYNGEGCISVKKQHNFHLAHITAFITAYLRLNMIEQLMSMKYESIIRICVDGIYYTGEMVKCLNVFRPKNGLNFNNIAGSSYVSVAVKRKLEMVDIKPREHYLRELHLGAGGSGKTEYNLTDKGLIKPMFIPPSWKLARSKMNEKGVQSTVLAIALSNDPQKREFIKSIANTLIIDEVSMMTEGQKNELFKLYGDMKIIMCGDLGFQLAPVEGVEMDTSGFDNIMRHKTDYRCRDPILREMKLCLRNMITMDVPNVEINEWVVNEFKLKNRCIDIIQLQNEYRIDDMILSGTNKIKDIYTNLFTGKFEKEKYYVLEKSNTYSKGDIVIGEKPVNCKSEIRHCFTTHSIQGETAKFKLFIDSNKMFSPRMYYTAISRARTLDQIYIIKRENEEI